MKPSGAAADFLPPAPPGASWKLVFSDEFDGPVLDAAKWDVPEYHRRDAEWSRRAVVLTGDGRLALKVFKEGATYYDGCARTKGKFEQAFGYFVARMKLQRTVGHWTAFWMYNDSVGDVTGDGMNGTEIDIMEKPWLDHRVQHTLHWDGYGAKHKSQGHVVEVPGIMDGWHDFGLLWTPDEYVFSVDGKETWRTRAGGVCQVPLYLKLSDELEVKGWSGDLSEAKLPDECQVEFVRAWDLVDGSGRRIYKPKPLP